MRPLNHARSHLLIATVVTALAFKLYVRVEGPTFLLGWIGLVPWLAALDRVTSLRRAFLAGLLMCEGFTLAVFFWFAPAIQDYTGAPLPVALLVLLAVAPLLQPQFISFALARTAAWRAGAAGWIVALAGAGVYVGSEWLLPKLFADTLGHCQYASPRLRQAADLAGAPGLTFVLVSPTRASWLSCATAHAAPCQRPPVWRRSS
jgi:apolipoprotein N-acyltransferase